MATEGVDKKRLREDDEEDHEDKPKKRKSRFSEPTEDLFQQVIQNNEKLDCSPPKKTSINRDDPEHFKRIIMKAEQALQLEKETQIQLKNLKTAIEENIIPNTEKKAAYIPLVLDQHGHHVDKEGNIVKIEAPIKTLKANIGGKKVNPYLENKLESKSGLEVYDPRVKTRDRKLRGKRAFNFIQEGTFVRQAEAQRFREARKILAGFTSGRNPNAKVHSAIAEVKESEENGENKQIETADEQKETIMEDIHEEIGLPPLPDEEFGPPAIEWWDQIFLPEELNKPTYDINDETISSLLKNLSLQNSKYHRFVQHPVSLKPLGGEAPQPHIPIYLTKQERKKRRRQLRMEREKEKQDKIALGLIPPPEPKMKLGNFMKILGDQAVADPSKIEKVVMEQVRQRQMNHEMRNQARKLTPQQLKEKKRKKLQEDTTRQVCVALFRVKDLSDAKHRFKVDVNAQQNNLTGGVLICKSPEISLVIVEGGPKAIKRYKKLMLRRVKWSGENDDEEEEESDSDDDEGTNQAENSALKNTAKCALVWEGVTHKRIFTSFKFQECNSALTARKVFEAKGVAHYWDMVQNYDPSAITKTIMF